MTAQTVQPLCSLCKRAGQQLVTARAAGSEETQVCADQASCVRARIARDAGSSLRTPHASGRSLARDTAEQYAQATIEQRGQPGVALAYGLAGVTHALLAVAEAITLAPATDLTGLLDTALCNIRDELAGARHDAAS